MCVCVCAYVNIILDCCTEGRTHAASRTDAHTPTHMHIHTHRQCALYVTEYMRISACSAQDIGHELELVRLQYIAVRVRECVFGFV